MKVAKYKLQVQSATNNPSMQPLLHSTCMVWICTICPCQVLGFIFFKAIRAHLIFSLCYFAPLPICSLSGPSGFISLSLSFQFPALSHPSVLPVALPAGSWPRHRWALCPGGSWWPAITFCSSLVAAAMGLGLCCFLFILVGKWKLGSCVKTASASLCRFVKYEYVVHPALS